MIFYAQASNRKFIDETLTIMADSFLNFLSRLSQDKKLKHKKGASQRINVEKNVKEPLVSSILVFLLVKIEFL